MSETSYFSGRVHSVLYENSSQAFYVLKIKMDDSPGPPTTIRGNVPGLPISVGTWFGFDGKWVDPPSIRAADPDSPRSGIEEWC